MDADNGGRARSDESVDRWIRDGLAPGAERVARVVSGALSFSETGAASGLRRAWPLAAGFMLILAIVGFVALRLRREVKPAPVAGVRAPVERITITNVSGRVELLYPPSMQPGREVHPGAHPGQPLCNVLYNRGGVVALAVCNGAPQYWVAGGEP
jgi:hypothetical protein